MRGIVLIAVLAGAAQVLGASALAQVPATPQASLPEPSMPPPTPAPTSDPNAEPPPAAPEAAPPAANPEPDAEPEAEGESPLAAAEPAPAPVPADPVVTSLRATLADPVFRKDQNADDLAALEAFYARHRASVWVTDMGLSAKGQAALFEIEKAGDWGLERAQFALPPADVLPANEEAQALA